MQKILVWDVPTRVFHWSLALSFLGAYISGDSERWRDLHIMFGYTMLGLIVFRLVWGIIGTRYARFSSFLYGPGRVLAYLKSLLGGENKHYVGHNPAGSWAIFAIRAGAVGWAVRLYVSGLGGEWLKNCMKARQIPCWQ
ncbi:MAG: cytochrome b/b6 domain-containing protein [Gammaproteobacteria bacterium]